MPNDYLTYALVAWVVYLTLGLKGVIARVFRDRARLEELERHLDAVEAQNRSLHQMIEALRTDIDAYSGEKNA